jgi:hypothetical protein
MIDRPVQSPTAQPIRPAKSTRNCFSPHRLFPVLDCFDNELIPEKARKQQGQLV